MRTLHHWVLDPFSRQVRLAIAEKGVRARLREEHVWDGRQDFLAINPAGATPVLVEGSAPKVAIIGARAILEYLEETEPAPALLPARPIERAEARRLADWFDRKFDAEVNACILFEKVEKKVTGQGPPDAAMIRRGREALKEHLRYVAQLAEARGYLAGSHVTIADLAAAGHLSCMDYLGEIDWSAYGAAKAWWRTMKGRASYATLLEDRLQGLPPAASYAAAV